MIKEDKRKQYGYQSDTYKKTSITIHNTNNYEMSARQLFNFLNSENKTSQGTHFLVDNKVLFVTI